MTKRETINKTYAKLAIGAALAVLAISYFAMNAGATEIRQCEASPTPTMLPCMNYSAYEYPQLQIICETPVATATPNPSETPNSSPVATESPRSVEGKDPPEKSDPCYYLSYTPECQAKYTPAPGVIWK